jgi:hypothetical protein
MAALMLAAAACGSSDDATESDSFQGAEAPTADFDAGAGDDEATDVAAEEEAGEAIRSEDGAGTGPVTTIAASEPAVGDDAAQAPGEDGAEGGEDELGAGGATVTPTAADLGRQLIFTARVHVEVDDVAAASAEATRIIQDLGGFVFGQNTTGGSEPSSELVFKVLPDDFNQALEALGTVGELRNQTVTTDDVTERVVDLESRIQVAELGVARLRQALEEAPTLQDYAEVERLLLDRESELEVMRGQLRTLQDRVDLATITLLLTQDRVENALDLVITSYEGHDDGESCPGPEDGFPYEAGTDVTLCFEIINIGDQTLTQIEMTDTVLEIDADTELIEVFGSLDELAPGQSALVAHQLTPERDLTLRTRVTAVPTDGISPEPAGPTVSVQVRYLLNTFEPDEDPGFGDGFSAGVSILQGIWIGIKVVVAFLIALLPLLVPVGGLVWWLRRVMRRRRLSRPTPPSSGPGGGHPPPPPPPPVPAASGTATTGNLTEG